MPMTANPIRAARSQDCLVGGFLENPRSGQAEIHTNCSQPIDPNPVIGDFEIIQEQGRSRENGPMCAELVQDSGWEVTERTDVTAGAHAVPGQVKRVRANHAR